MGHVEVFNGRSFWLDGTLGGFVIGGADAASHTPQLYRWLIERFECRSVIDLGCGLGHSLAAFDGMDLGLRTIGLEGCQRAVRESAAPGHVFSHDFTEGPYQAPQSDLCLSVEFLEHLEEKFLPNVMATIRAARCKVLAITAALPGTPGHNHVNCKPPEYWVSQFGEIGYRLDIDATSTAKIIAGTSRLDHGRPYFVISGMVYVKAEVT